MGKYQSISEFLEKELQPLYLSHIVKAISDAANKKEYEKRKNEQEFNPMQHDLIEHGFMRFFEIKLIEDPFVESGCQVIVNHPIKKDDEARYTNILVSIIYSAGFKKNPKLLRLLLAHELGHIYLRHVSKQYRIRLGKLVADDDEELEAWRIASEIIYHRDNFYRNAEKLCHCCYNEIINSITTKLKNPSKKTIDFLSSLRKDSCRQCGR